MKILFYRDETKIASSARGDTTSVNCPWTNGVGRTAVGGYVGKLYAQCHLWLNPSAHLYVFEVNLEYTFVR